MNTVKVINIQRFSLHDGPGIRTSVFFKGCPLRCKWCCNPESRRSETELGFDAQKCARCSRCAAACPAKSISYDGGTVKINRKTCTRCLRCTKVCLMHALFGIGEEYSVQGLIDEVLKDRVFFDTSGGGVTLSGGEPLMHKDFVLEFLKKLKACNLHVTAETSGETGFLEQALGYIDVLYFDVKHYDCKKHKEMTGAGNKRILENLKLAVLSGADIVARIPVIPGFNDSKKDCEELCGLLCKLGVKNAHLLPFHQMGTGKYERMGLEYMYRSHRPIEKEELADMQKYFINRGVDTQIGG